MSPHRDVDQELQPLPVGLHQDDGRYRRAIKDLNRLLDMAARSSRVRLGLANYEHEELSPARSTDLVRAAENPEDNPFYPYFKKRLTELLKKEQPSLIFAQLFKPGPVYVRNDRFS
jgi:hypothetical protein